MSPIQPTPPPDETPLRIKDESVNPTPPNDDAFLKSLVITEDSANDDQNSDDQNSDDQNSDDQNSDEVKTQDPEDDELVAELLPDRKE